MNWLDNYRWLPSFMAAGALAFIGYMVRQWHEMGVMKTAMADFHAETKKDILDMRTEARQESKEVREELRQLREMLLKNIWTQDGESRGYARGVSVAHPVPPPT